MNKNEHKIALTDEELDKVAGGLNVSDDGSYPVGYTDDSPADVNLSPPAIED